MSDSHSYALSLKAERPVVGCALQPVAYLYVKGGMMDNLVRQKIMEANPHRFEYEWQRGPRKSGCANSACPRRESFEPQLWSRASLGGCALQCAVCFRLGSRADNTFCSEACFFSAWQEHCSVHVSGKSRPRDAESLGDEGGGGENGGSGGGGGVAAMYPRYPYSDGGDGSMGGDALSLSDHVTICKESTYTPTADDVGCTLRIVVTALSVNDGSRMAGPVVVVTSPVLSQPRSNPVKQFLQQQNPPPVPLSSSPIRFKVVSYNILAELYATRQAYPYCDSWTLSWPFRKKMILQELEDVNSDVVCLQEVQADHFEQHLNPYLTELGYDGLYKQKSRESMGQYGKVDGCAVFWKRNKFVMTENYSIEFNEIARRGAMELGLDENEARRYMNRLSRDNVAQIVVLEVLSGLGVKANRQQARVCIVNTHLYSNVQRPDVKLWQCLSLLHELEQFVSQRDLALMICGDFNSEPNSAVYELLTDGQLNTHHPELEQHSEHAVHVLPDQSEIYHSLDLASAIGGVMGSEPLFTNYTAMFKGTLDYIFYNPQRLYVTSCTNLPSAQEIQSTSGEGLPSACYPSDHLLQGVEVILTMSGSVNRHGGHHGGGGGGGGHHHGRASLR